MFYAALFLMAVGIYFVYLLTGLYFERIKTGGVSYNTVTISDFYYKNNGAICTINGTHRLKFHAKPKVGQLLSELPNGTQVRLFWAHRLLAVQVGNVQLRDGRKLNLSNESSFWYGIGHFLKISVLYSIGMLFFFAVTGDWLDIFWGMYSIGLDKYDLNGVLIRILLVQLFFGVIFGIKSYKRHKAYKNAEGKPGNIFSRAEKIPERFA